MIRKTTGIFAALAVALTLHGIAAVEQPPPGAIHVITVQQAITAATARYVQTALEHAAATQAEVLVIQLDTPGGLLDATRDIVQDILNASLPVVVYIAPSGARGASAGTIISMASHVAAMAPATHIGAAHPVSIFGGDDNKVMGEKILNDTAAYIESLAHLRQRNVEWAISAVRESKSVIADKALELKVIDLIAEDLGDLMRQLQGREVRMSRERVVMLQTAGRPIVMQDMSISQSFMSVVSNPNVVFLLLIIGLVGLYMEFSNPGLIFPGVLGAMSLLIALIAMQTLPVSYGALALMLLGVALLVAEAFVPSFGVLGIGGLACVLIGALFLLDQSLTDLRISRPMIFAAVGVVGLTALVIGRLLVKSQRMHPRSAQDNLVGRVGRVRHPIAPPHEGQVLLNGELWRARAQEPLAADDEVVVEAVEGLLLTVAKVPAAGRAQPVS
ncbi:MAG: nodulation protein NfeD [Candidatus Lambdaproteobacteria bacterium]|nr:nodulation protein NfeD [Candidatus Lambdaproteobacteria bacterium]